MTFEAPGDNSSADDPAKRGDPTTVVVGGGPRRGKRATGSAIVVSPKVPDTLLVFPLRRAVPFPNLMMPVLLDAPRSREIFQKAEAGNGHVLLIAQKDPLTGELKKKDEVTKNYAYWLGSDDVGKGGHGNGKVVQHRTLPCA